MLSNFTILCLVLVILVVCLPGQGVYAFGAGNIPRCVVESYRKAVMKWCADVMGFCV